MRGGARLLLWGPEYETASRISVILPALVTMKGYLLLQLIKYGVIDVARLTHDLQAWESLYVSGRMHKPVSEHPL